MLIKLEIPISDFKRLISELDDILRNDFIFGQRIVRNQIIEKGGYRFTIKLNEGYDHDKKEFADYAKVELTISSIAPDKVKDIPEIDYGGGN